MSDLQRYVPNGCEFYQYRETMEDIRDWHGPSPGSSRPMLFKTLTVRRKSDGHFFAMSWRADSDPEDILHEAKLLAESTECERVGGRRIDLGEANLGQRILVLGDPAGRVPRSIVAIDDQSKRYKAEGFVDKGGELEWFDWSRAREP